MKRFGKVIGKIPLISDLGGRDGCTPDITFETPENVAEGSMTRIFPSDCSRSEIEGSE